MNGPPPTATVIYDGHCGFCAASVSWLRAHALPGALRFLPSQSPLRRAWFPSLTDAQCGDGIHLLLPDGRVFSGDRALPEILARTRGWWRVAWLARWLATLGLTAPFYRWIARHRHQLPGAPAGRTNRPVQ
jgi:predicted DCC family thiol-disulfide oxidoreductase YuxK